MLKAHSRNFSSKNQAGVSLIEVMIAVLVLGIGLLGIINLQNRSLEYNQQAYLYSQATILAWDIAERMQANPDGGDDYLINFGAKVSSATDCEVTNCSSPSQIAQWDLAQWLETLERTLPQGKAEITQEDPDVNEYSVVIELDVEKSGTNNLDQLRITFRI